MSAIDPRAIVSPKAELAEGVTVGPYAVIEAGVTIGKGTWVGPHAVIKGETTIGVDNKIFQFASIGEAPQDLKYKGEPTRLQIGDRNVFREFTTMNRGTAQGGGLTVIANAPNPAGQSILSSYFGDGVSPLWLAAGAIVPTIIVGLCFWFL